MRPADPQPSPPAFNAPGTVLAAVFGLGLLGAAAIVAIVVLRPGEDNAALITSVVGFLAPTMAALLALIKSAQTGAAVEELHIAVNSRLTELLEQTAKASKSQGREESEARQSAQQK